MARQISDPGFGIKLGGTGRIVKRDGSLNVERTGDSFHWSDFYHMLLLWSWTKYLGFTLALYIVVNGLFGGIYFLIGTDKILNASSGDWLVELSDAMFFSAQTLTTVGYGNLAPGSPLVSTIASLEALAGLFIFGIFTGISYGRFSRIKPRITFADTAVLAPHRDGLNAFMCRLVNERSSVVMDSTANLLLVMQDPKEPQHNRRYYQLPLDITHISTLALNWTLVHTITSDSPLSGLHHRDLVERNAEFLVIITAFDDTVGQQFYARYSYRPSEVIEGARFDTMFETTTSGDVILHVDRVHDVTSIPLHPVAVERATLDEGSGPL
ncbi:MAG: potassium transporter [Candidatus Kapabacteria bacterium]|nr:potassium transporter [Candidatus Kapabacteria bacterium]